MQLNDFIIEPLEINPIVSKEILEKNISVGILRLDKIDKHISGNKLFKLFYFLKEAQNASHKTLLTFGGAYSNHLAATAFACHQCGLKAIGIVRGEKTSDLSPTLKQCTDFGMQLKFVSRSLFNDYVSGKHLNNLKQAFGDYTHVPMGGFGKTGADGAALIIDLIPKNIFSHLAVSVGTATTLAGLLKNRDEIIVAFPALKGMNGIHQRIKECGVESKENLKIIADYHFGGFARKNDQLIQFMNDFYSERQIPLDFVYTGKMMFGMMQLLRKDFFPKGSKILCVHTGGLQGNQSISEHLIYKNQ